MTERLPDSLWTTIQQSIPIFCVDVVPARRDPEGQLEVGLILRAAPEAAERWCLIGGRLRLDETIAEAVERELSSALGGSLTPDWTRPVAPLIVEYRRSYTAGQPYDPRQHAVSTTFPIWMAGEGVSRGPEAKDFRWWRTTELNGDVMGFGQESLVQRLQDALLNQPAAGT